MLRSGSSSNHKDLKTLGRRTLFVVFFALSLSALGQEKEIKAYRTFGGMRFEMDTLTLTHRQVGQVISINQAAFDEFKKARTSNAISGVLGFSGAVLLVIPVFTSIIGGEPEWLLAAGGAGLVIASIPFTKSYKRHAESAIGTYNSSLTESRLYFTGTGIVVKF